MGGESKETKRRNEETRQNNLIAQQNALLASQAAQTQNTAAQTTYNNTFEAYKPSELETRLEKESLDWMDFISGKNGPVDFSKAPGLVNLNLADEAVGNRFAERSATGGLQFGKDGANATALAMRKQQLADQMAERRGVDLVGAVRAKDASVRGEVAPFLIGAAENRNQFRVGSAGNNAASSRGAATQTGAQGYGFQPIQPGQSPFWQTALTAGIAGLGSAFSGRA